MKRFLLLCLLSIFSFAIYGNVYFRHLGKAEGLPQVSVCGICQDELGRMWFGTLEGLCCWDGNTMITYDHFPADTHSFLRQPIFHIAADKQGNIFFISGYNLVRYNLYKHRFSQLKEQVGALYVHGHKMYTSHGDSIFKWNQEKEQLEFVYHTKLRKNITHISLDDNGCMWIGTNNGLYKTENFKATVCVIPKVNVYSLYSDSKSCIWVAAYRNGMYKVEYGITSKITIPDDYALSDNDVRNFIEDDKGNLWVATFKGLNRIDSLGNVTCYEKDNRPGGLSHSSIFPFYKDMQGTIWTGTFYGGANYFNPLLNEFTNYIEGSGKGDLSFSFIGNMTEDKRGDLWICTEGGGLNCLNRKTHTVTHYLTGNDGRKAFPNLKSIEYDEQHDCLYIGTHKQGLIVFDIASKKVVIQQEKGKERYFAQLQLYDGNLYANTYFEIKVLDTRTHVVWNLHTVVEEAKGVDFFFIDDKGYIWLAKQGKIVKVNLRNPEEKRTYKTDAVIPKSFMICSMAEHPNGNIYIGTNGVGFYELNPETGAIKTCPNADFNYCYNMQFSSENKLFVSNEKGLSIYLPQTAEAFTLNADRNLHLSSLNEGCGLYLCRDGELFVGGVEGLASFKSDLPLNISFPYNIYFASLAVNSIPMLYDDTKRMLDMPFPFARQLRLRHNENNITITIANNNYIGDTGLQTYEYCLEGYDKRWNLAHGNTITYTNLSPGKYRLAVREKNSNPRNGDKGAIFLPIVVYAPWWGTWWAYFIYGAIVVAVVYVIVKNRNTQMKLRASLAQEKFEKEKEEELVQAKIQFFANISHEFRTPLTMIISQIEMLLQSERLTPYLRLHLKKILRNSYQFKDLISELLEFRKMERGKMHLKVREIDLIDFVEQIYQDYRGYAQQKGITLRFLHEADALACWCDGKQMRKVLSNLLTNAFKHTPAGGKVDLQILEKDAKIEIKVMDSGEGIPREMLPFIFDRFFQVDNKVSSAGSGIGLHLCKGIMELHHGGISVQSALQYGSIFTVTLLEENPFANDPEVVIDTDEALAYESRMNGSEVDETAVVAAPDSAEATAELPLHGSVLVVEDNEDLLDILTSLLSPIYKVSIALNGKEGLKKAEDEQPDLILSDVMMPEMTGTEMCMRIKQNFDLCHIPVILLTALTSEDNKMEGLQCGADDYIEKPFSSKILLGRIDNVLRNRKLLKKKLMSENIVEEKETSRAEVEMDEKGLVLCATDLNFLQKLEKLVDEHLTDPEFNVDTIARKMAVSRSALYNKLKALGSVTPNQYIMNCRLKRAVHLMQIYPEMSVTDVAIQSGFSTVRYFRYCYKARFGVTPKQGKNKPCDNP